MTLDRNRSLYQAARSIYHSIRWSQRIKGEYKINCERWGQDYAHICNDLERAQHSLKPSSKIQPLFNKKTEFIRSILIDLLPEPPNNACPLPKNTKPTPKIIWLYWWDGFDSAPMIVKACVTSIQKAAGSAKVIFLDKYNYSEYIELPEDIVQKHDSGVIGHAHYSDIVRLSLLAKYGGLWMDATLYCSHSLPDYIWENSFFTCKQNQENPLVPSHLRWAGWLLGGEPDFPLFRFARDLLIEYWRHYDWVIDYLLMDYVFDLAYEQIDEVRDAVDTLSANNPDRHELMKIINEPHDEGFFNSETFVYKLSYRYGNPQTFTKKGELTFFGFITKSVLQQKVLVITGPTAPLNSTNTNLMQKIVNSIPQSKIVWLSIGPYNNHGWDSTLLSDITLVRYSTLLKCIVGSPLGFQLGHLSRFQQFICKVRGRLSDRKGYGEGADCFVLTKYVERLHAHYHFDTIFACIEPFSAGYAMAFSRVHLKRVLYLIDPPATIVPGMEHNSTPFRNGYFPKVISRSDKIITTERIRNALNISGYPYNENKLVCTEFPLISKLDYSPEKAAIAFSEHKINLLYCGWLRNAEFFSKIIEKLDNRFCVTFLGNDNDCIKMIHTKAEIRVFSQVERQVAIDAIMDADILVSIGNPYPVHIPSKIFDYISSGKPVIHFYSIPDCPALKYYERYPLAMCVSDKTAVSEAHKNIVNFCVSNKGKRESWHFIREIFADVLAEKTINRIIDSLTEWEREEYVSKYHRARL